MTDEVAAEAHPSGRRPLAPALAGERHELEGRHGRLSYSVSGPANGPAPPLLLVHSVNAAASAYEMKPLYDHYSRTRRVYAPDLPGFGLSERSDRPYTIRLMTDAVLALLAEIDRQEGGTPCDVLALSLGAEFGARAALERPAAVRTLGLISATGLAGRRRLDGPPGSNRGRAWLYAALARAPWREALFGFLTRPAVVRWFLEKTWGAKKIDEGLLAYDIATARQPGARHAPFAFVAGFLFAADITRVYEGLRLPVWLLHGTRGDFVDYRQATAMAARPNWRIDVLPTGALPHFEQLGAFVARYDAFLADAARASADATIA